MQNIPFTIEGTGSLITFVATHKNELEKNLSEYGALLLRGFNTHSMDEFQKISEMMCEELVDYVFRSTPRTRLIGKVYSSTEYPNNHEIPLHNENSYSLNWPGKVCFYCLVEPYQCGETPIANSHNVYQLIDPAVRQEFEQKKIMYVRNYGLGIDLPWQEVFQTQKKSEVERFCEANAILFEWFENDSRLRTKQICQAVIRHPLHGIRLWFNQAHLFHESANDPEVREYFSNNYRSDEFPRNCFFGDGTPIDDKLLAHIREAYTNAKIIFPWKKGDLLILDNLHYAHGRRPFQGERKIIVTMGK
ncbi:TauD/TfdA family dioxygenase [Legionella oakridgensis]|uniref:TauD/TfdA family dioxygenase n=1 Tax=Legionella oakridgensis TaxID=29423 RepID=UPI00138AC48F|nr:TauD/TfdA family dioxygenase [Legionella oakridgensis]